MGTCYTYLLYDDFDWGYNWDKSKDDVIEDIKKEFPVASVLAQWNHYIVVDLDKINPYGDKIQPLQKFCESARYYTDVAQWDLSKVVFKKLPEDVEKEKQEPSNRNKEHIDKAFEEWKEKFKLPNE